MATARSRHIFKYLVTVFAVIFIMVKAIQYTYAIPAFSPGPQTALTLTSKRLVNIMPLKISCIIEKSWEQKIKSKWLCSSDLLSITLFISNTYGLTILESKIEKRRPVNTFSTETNARLCVFRI